LLDKEPTNSDCSGTDSSSTSSSNLDSISRLKFELSSSFRFGSGDVDVKSYNEAINVVSSNVGFVEGDTNDTLSIKEDVGDCCPLVLCSKDIVSDSDSS